MELVISLLQKGLLEKALDLAISELFFNARSPDDIKKALKIGYDINAVNSNGNNAIFACRTLEAMDCLLSYGINIHHINGHGQNALFHQKNPEILKKLIELGLDTSHTDTNGYTCIFEHYRNAEGLTELINAGCDINHIDKKGMNILFMPLSPEVLSVAIDAGCNVNQIDHSGKGFIENVYDYELHDIILSHIDKFDRRTLHVDFCDLDSAFFLYYLSEHGFKIELNKDHFTINSYISDYKEILSILDFISEIHDIHFYKYKGGPLYKDIDKRIIKWMIRNNLLVDLSKINKHKDYEEINSYKIRREQKEISRHLKPAKSISATVKNGGRL
ncbi:TPA: ankyrin repeat domain-containing protein [Escherichia coli]|uniref:ankyrin repeat domain-containing protein n=1 Tax=Escherichia coli TaxID=562 RepID=UPI0019B2A564|nr:ankyrin repeat domain-containing protein [Escherichia coli]HBZ7768748.1 ankyrin repeat domain-containing protein [Klebsiella variicola subsp. variicola]HAX8586031.1 ankyrin repeat domain-containing protein [Escherichia coli]HBC7794923.1 ankyrin repeat domain-containing protein [Escherichia coli]HBZ7805351.1 ankyrin repeat domain-containing protein [Klebsiella variicola subsp. variicola]